MKNKYPKRIWVEASKIKETKHTTLCLTSAKVWGYDLALDKKEYIEYRLVVKKKKRSLK